MSSPPIQQNLQSSQNLHRTLTRKLSEESIRTELCEGPVPEPPVQEIPAPKTPEGDVSTTCSDRAELIERLKKGESPTWIPNRHFDSIWNQESLSPTRSPKRPTTSSSTLLPPPTITPEQRDSETEDEKRRQEGLKIARPRSALHSGDFTQDDSPRDSSSAQDGGHVPSQPRFGDHSAPWLADLPPRDFTHFQSESPGFYGTRLDDVPSGFSSLSSSISASFAYKPPTSPLVQSESNDDIDLTSPMDGIDIGSSLSRQSRRHTVMTARSGSYGYSPTPLHRQPLGLRQERSFPYQAHQPRRSLTSTPNFMATASSSSPQTPAFLRSRRPSFTSEISPLQHASMVGSYEESILRGRMSTTPSKPLDFLAQIGVLGLGKCKSSLRCPPHVTLPFPAVFYSYANSSHGRSKEEDGPSPYVGQIDLENGLPNQEEDVRTKRKLQNRALERKAAEDDGVNITNPTTGTPESEARRAQRHKRRSGSPRAPPGGSYRIPEKGQIQIIIKNPNKTAVKLFLVPYDLAGMEPGTKTFVRQRSYSNGPIIDNMPDLKDHAAGNRPILRYLIHLHMCCTARGRYYLYKSIRVVFANRVPDGKEKLQNEITLPEPRFTPYKPIRVMHPPVANVTGPGALLAADKAFRRRSSGFYFGQHFDVAEGLPPPSLPQQPHSFNFARDHIPVEPIPFKIPRDQLKDGIERSSSASGPHSIIPLESPNASFSQASCPTQNWGGISDQIGRYDKLSKGDVGYGGNAFSGLINGNPGVAESLLSQRLRTLGVQAQVQAQQQRQEQQEQGPGMLEEE
ncbi:hypothetical protein F4810DRAFT_704113 [Camillea tinctor]|nr:hypothetical protein F4810DRAFT_704113 [Camillea tinctor]